MSYPSTAQNLETTLVFPSGNKPSTSSFFTARSTYNDVISALQAVQKECRAVLEAAYLLPISPARRRIIKSKQGDNRKLWMPIDKLSDAIGMQPPMRVSQYREVISQLSELDDYLAIALSGRQAVLADQIEGVLKQFERPDMQAILSAKKKPVVRTQLGGTYTIGKRKESHARVWLIPAKLKRPSRPTTLAPPPDPWGSSVADKMRPALLDMPGFEPQPARPLPAPDFNPSFDTAYPKFVPFVSEVLINNTPLSRYFANSADREKVVLPFKVTGTIGKYNVFAIVRGGGTTGQAGAVAHGIAKGLNALFPQGKGLLQQAELLRRDPRMVERKKTGLAKARKRYAWVKR
ncbi:ribosomal protein S9/S16-domain-containing protein [Cantharellus anzutake]|uniref:ribosomal protein S9/S16-domain-containing protein n=1 Tax=Cantharellus anzutake TaxID=1750568 RepID=UPI0019031AAC|nr:ribosomal protein S9/S16-domain-containing protein [Cantharellus anzutake]KAF8325241.1 ribosomal protein S9/S16-domain-containing protein [Cantharellus anzutake]